MLKTYLIGAVLSISPFLFTDSIDEISSAYQEEPMPYPILEKPVSITRLNSIEVIRLVEEKKWYQLSLLYIKAQKLADAKHCLKEALAQQPDLYQAHVQLGFILLWENDLENAAHEFRLSLKENPYALAALFGLEQLALQWSNTPDTEQKALNTYHLLLQYAPNNPDYLFYYGRMLSRIHEWEEAKETLLRCLALAPEYVDAAMQLATIYIRENQLDKAQALYERYPESTEARVALAALNQTEEAVSVITDKPSSAQPLDQEKSSQLSKDHEWYALAKLYIKACQFSDAKNYLHKALIELPKFSEAHTQLGFIFLWENKLDAAYHEFLHSLKILPCISAPLMGLEHIARIWSSTLQKKALSIYKLLLQCSPDHPDYLFYYGRLLTWMHHTKHAEQVLLRCLDLAPQYIDAALQLANLYMQNNELDKAEKLYSQYPDHAEAHAGLAKIAARRGDAKTAHEHFDSALKADPTHKEIRLSYAKSLMGEMQYSMALQHYQFLLYDDPYNGLLWKDLFEAKSHTNCAIWVEGSYIEGQEHDPDLKAPVVKEYYSNEKLHLLIPIRDQWLVDLRGIFSHQKENSIYPPVGVNYNVLLAGGQINSSLQFLKNWNWDVVAREFKAWGSGPMSYPFQNTHRFEPGTSIRYNTDHHSVIVDAHVESFIIKNYDNITSELLKTSFIDGGYTWHPDFYLHPSISGWVARIFYQDNMHNIRNDQDITLNFGIPFLDRFVDAGYLFEHATFKKINQNYYSFKRQMRNTARITLHTKRDANGYLELIYDRTWQRSYDLFQPIGDFVFVAPTQFIIENKIWLNFNYRVKDKIRFELGGFYYRDTLPSWYYNIKGSLLWHF